MAQRQRLQQLRPELLSQLSFVEACVASLRGGCGGDVPIASHGDAEAKLAYLRSFDAFVATLSPGFNQPVWRSAVRR